MTTRVFITYKCGCERVIDGPFQLWNEETKRFVPVSVALFMAHASSLPYVKAALSQQGDMWVGVRQR